jgi:uncharacterized protein (DUF362 family)
MSFVGLVQTQSLGHIKDSILEALNLINFNTPNSIKSVVIKPNLCYYWDAATGQTTDPRVVAGIIDIVREKCGKAVGIKVVEADASAMQTKYAFTVLGYDELCKEKNVELFNLSSDTLVEKSVTVGKHKMSFQVPQLLLNCDFFINVPKLKIMRSTHITCALKNIFGCIAYPRKVTYHPLLGEAIVGINKVLKPHLNIVDGLVALGRFPVKLNLLMAGEYPFSVDWVAAKVMGYNPSRINFLNLAIKERLGNPKDTKVVGEKIETFRKDFPTENNLIARVKMSLQSSLLKTYSRLSGDIIPPNIEEA